MFVPVDDFLVPLVSHHKEDWEVGAVGRLRSSCFSVSKAAMRFVACDQKQGMLEEAKILHDGVNRFVVMVAILVDGTKDRFDGICHHPVGDAAIMARVLNDIFI